MTERKCDGCGKPNPRFTGHTPRSQKDFENVPSATHEIGKGISVTVSHGYEFRRVK